MRGTVDAMRAGQMVETLIAWHQKNMGATLSAMEEQVQQDQLGKEMVWVMTRVGEVQIRR